jgi:hypothetical protein
LELKERHFEAPKGAPLYMCPRDGYVVFRNSEVILTIFILFFVQLCLVLTGGPFFLLLRVIVGMW